MASCPHCGANYRTRKAVAEHIVSTSSCFHKWAASIGKGKETETKKEGEE